MASEQNPEEHEKLSIAPGIVSKIFKIYSLFFNRHRFPLKKRIIQVIFNPSI